MAKTVKAKCQTCGKESEVEWTLATKCPVCGSEKFFPVIFIDSSEGGGERAAAAPASRKPIGTLVALLFLVVAIGVLAVRFYKTTRQPEYAVTVTMICTNENCSNPNPEKLFRKELPTRDVFPHITCPFCKKEMAYRAVRCRNCLTIFALRTEGKKNPTLDLVCPNCGSGDINLDSASIPLEADKEEE